MSKPFVLGLITARGGSIRLPRKNAKEFCGHPLVAWSIMQSRCSRLVDETVLTTDDEEIASIGRRYGAKVIMRPVLDNDITAGVVFKMAVEELEKQGMKIDEIMCLLPTSPLKKPNDLDDIISAFHLINTYKDENEMATFIPQRETFVFRNVEDMTTTFNKPYHVTRAIANKLWNYSVLAGGWGIAKRDYLMKTWSENPMYDSEIDQSLDEHMFDNRKEILGYALEPWQALETDYDYYFRICEALMEEFVLNGQGMDVYTRYAREFRKIVTWEEETKNIDLSKYIGNSNQLGE